MPVDAWKYSTGVTWFSPGLELNDLGYLNRADEINQENNLSYTIVHPVSVFRTFDISLSQYNTFNFNGDHLGSGGYFSFYSEFKNLWHVNFQMHYNSKSLDTRILRGGYPMRMPASVGMTVGLSTDPSKVVVAGIIRQL